MTRRRHRHRRRAGGLEALGQALLDVFAHLDAVYHHVDVVALVLFQLGQDWAS
jgi:hypothetical protein